MLAGLVGHWMLDDESGNTAADASGNDNEGTLRGGPRWTAGRIGGALEFDGVDGYFVAAASTVSAMLRSSSAKLPRLTF